MKHLKENLPLILLISVVPYFFYSNPTLPQAVIATALATLCGFKYFLEYNAQPDYRKMFQVDITDRDNKIKAHIEKLINEIDEVREKSSFKNVAEFTQKKRDSINW